MNIYEETKSCFSRKPQESLLVQCYVANEFFATGCASLLWMRWNHVVRYLFLRVFSYDMSISIPLYNLISALWIERAGPSPVFTSIHGSGYEFWFLSGSFAIFSVLYKTASLIFNSAECVLCFGISEDFRARPMKIASTDG